MQMFSKATPSIVHYSSIVLLNDKSFYFIYLSVQRAGQRRDMLNGFKERLGSYSVVGETFCLTADLDSFIQSIFLLIN